MRNAYSLSLDFHSLHLLYHGLACAHAQPRTDWHCRRITFVGDLYRWSPLITSHEGLAFLSQITHLVLCIPPTDILSEVKSDTFIPVWINDVPFSSMSNLTHFAFPLIPPYLSFSYDEIDMLAYTAPPDPSFTPITFRTWALGDQPRAKGTIIADFGIMWVPSKHWDSPYLQSDSIWDHVDCIRAAG
jgi:hypothetical protein